MKKRNKIFDLSAISIIACDCLQAVICIFIDLFFISKILNNPGASVSKNILSIGLFYVIEYAVLASSYLVSGFALRKINKSFFVSIGSILLAGVVLLVYFLQNNFMAFVPLIAFVYGLAWAFFSSGYNNLTAETISSKHQVKFFAVKKIMFQLTYIIFPISLGYIADFDFTYAIYVILGISALLVMFSFLIKPKKSYQLSFNWPKFAKHLKENKQATKPLWMVYVAYFFRGASYDCFTTLITILVMKTFQSNSSLGTFQSIFTACSLITMFFYLRYYRKKRAKAFIVPTITLVALAVIGILCATNQVTIIIFYAIYAVLNVILMSIADSRRAGVVRVLSLHSHILESNAICEVFLGVGRVLTSTCLLLAGLFDSMVGSGSTIFLKVALGIVCFMYVMYGVSLVILEKALIKQDEEFRKAHMEEALEKAED